MSSLPGSPYHNTPNGPFTSLSVVDEVFAVLPYRPDHSPASLSLPRVKYNRSLASCTVVCACALAFRPLMIFCTLTNGQSLMEPNTSCPPAGRSTRAN